MKNFGAVPSVRFRRSKFTLGHGHKTTMSVGYLYPVDVQEVLPGDSFKTNIHNVARVSSSFIKPVIDNLFMDIYSFFVPFRLINEDNDRVFGNPNPSAYVDNELIDMPTNTDPIVISEKTVGDYLGLPTKVQIGPGEINLLPFRAFALVYDQWFRNENIIDEMYINKSRNGNSNEICNNNDWSPSNYFGKPPKVGKKKDYFTSCLPNTQKGAPVNLPLGTVAPVLGGNVDNDLTGSSPLKLYINNTTQGAFTPPAIDTFIGLNNLNGNVGTNAGGAVYSAGVGLYPANLFTDLSEATASNVNDIRFAFQLQRMLERDSLYGSRYNEYLLGHFGVYSPDSRLQFAECLGGGRVPINIQQVEQTSQASEESPLGNVAGYSWSVGKSRYSKGFTEHGYIVTVACLRQVHTYQQGVPKMFLRKNRNDIYDPAFANLGEQPVFTSELYLKPMGMNTGLKDNVFGYNEAWAEYRYNPSKITGEMRSNATNSLDIWHFADNYSSQPYLVQDFVEETPNFVDRTLSVPSTSQDQFIVDWWFDKEAIRVMPTYSVPGLIDHH